MKKIITIFIIIMSINSTFSFDKDKVYQLINSYASKVALCFEGEESLRVNRELVIGECFAEDLDAKHNYDLFDNKNIDISISTYLSLRNIEKYFKKIQVNIGEIYIYDCLYNDVKSGKNYVIATFDKELIYKGNKKNVTFLLNIDISSSPYIKNVFFRELHPELQPRNCTDASETSIQDEKRAITIQKILFEANNLYKSQNYIDAKNKYKEALEFSGGKNEIAKERINDCDSLIKANMVIESINELIQTEFYQNAQTQLINLKLENKYSFDLDWYDNSIKKCSEGLRIKNATNKIELADYYFSKKMFAVAKKKYRTALHYNHRADYIKKQIEACELGDPNFVKNQIQEAYYQALATRKNYLATFRTYMKYEQSGLLTGEQYYFMSVVMLGDKKVIKGMGYSKSLAKSLAREYFYKSKQKGCSKCDLSFLETQVFTSNINRKH